MPRHHACGFDASVALHLGTTCSSYCVVLRNACKMHPLSPYTICPPDFPTCLAINQSTQAVMFVGPEGRPPALQGPYMLYKDLSFFTLPLVLGGDWASTSSNADPALVECLHGYLSSINTTMNATQLASISLKGLWELAWGEIQKAETQGARAKGSISVVITYPNDWDSGVKGRFENAAQLAGISGFADKLTFIPEHEAIARVIQRCLLAEPEPFIRAGDPIIVVNCGDVNIDVTALDFPTTGSGPDMSALSGTKCLLNGLSAMDVNFEKLITKELERQTGKTQQNWSRAIHRAKVDALIQWNRVKFLSLGKGPLSHFCYYAVEGKRQGIHRDDLNTSIFEPATQPIVDAIIEFCRKPECNSPKAVFMMGEMSHSREIKKFVCWGVKQALGNQSPPVLVRDDLYNAVPLGAAEYGLSQLN